MSMTEIAKDLSPVLRVYKDGRVERLWVTDFVPPSLDPKTNVLSKDVVYSPESNLSSRLYLPRATIDSNQKLPLLIYYHGGGFCVESAFSTTYHNHLNTLVEEANVIALSVDYRLAPEHAIPVPYDDSWDALKWASSHSKGDGPEEWLNSHADFDKVFVAGDSAGANIAYQMAIRYGQEKSGGGGGGINVVGIVLVHPYFWGKEPIGNEDKEPEKRAFIDGLWHLACPTTTSGCDDPLINPSNETNLAGLGCTKVLVLVAEKDGLRDRGRCFYEKLMECGWEGSAEIVETKGEGHVFHLLNPEGENAPAMLKSIASFLNQNA